MAQLAFLPGPVRRVVRGSPILVRALQVPEALLFGLLWGVFWLLPVDLASRLGRAVLRRVGPRLRRKTTHIRENLAIAARGRSPDEIEALVREVWGSFGAVIGELPHCGELASDPERVEIVLKGELRALREPGRPAVFVTPHVGNWEMSASAAGRLGVPITIPYAPSSNPLVDVMLLHFRRSLWRRMVPRERGLRALMAELSAGRSIGLAPDHRAEGSESIPFFGVPTPTTLVPAKLALRYGVELVPALVERLEGARFRVVIEEPIVAADPRAPADVQARQMTEKMNTLFAAWIGERPGQWVFTNRRWPKRSAGAEPPDPQRAAGVGRSEVVQHGRA